MALITFSKKSTQTIKAITNSQYLDVVGLVIVLIGSIVLGYHKTEIPIHFNNSTYNFPLGIFSILNVGFSMMSTRLVTKKNNFGNLIGTINTALSGTIDFLLGNAAAILTYPISFVGNYIAYRFWKKNKILNSIDAIFYRNLFFGMVLSLVLNYIGFINFSDKPIDWQLFFAIAIPAGISFGGTFNNSRMYPDNWFMWQLYNLSKIVQSVLILNIANTIKYIFYFFNAIIGYITWNDDKKRNIIIS
ncbi:nicotinamide mononucleotide transporter family protein [Flavobacterium sp.]|uniref:nicotinamide mononucleotide transporter family protein n=1 Tax=Flavobacterium sp. TaxID=239 RepID=UPI003340C38D